MKVTPHRLAFAPTALYGGVELRTASFWVGPSTVTSAHGFWPPAWPPAACLPPGRPILAHFLSGVPENRFLDRSCCHSIDSGAESVIHAWAEDPGLL
jgi:hypothetical protein